MGFAVKGRGLVRDQVLKYELEDYYNWMEIEAAESTGYVLQDLGPSKLYTSVSPIAGITTSDLEKIAKAEEKQESRDRKRKDPRD